MKRLMLLIAILGICFLIFPQITNASSAAKVQGGDNVTYTDTKLEEVTGTDGNVYNYKPNTGTYLSTDGKVTLQFIDPGGTTRPKFMVQVGWTIKKDTSTSQVVHVDPVIKGQASIEGTFNGVPAIGFILFQNPDGIGINIVDVTIADGFSGSGTYDFSLDQLVFNGDMYQGPGKDAGMFGVGTYDVYSGSAGSFSLTGMLENEQVPEPATILGGLAAIFGIAWRKRKVFWKS